MEKYDGVRVYWTGDRLFSVNSKKIIPIPEDIKSTFPDFPFEGELWYEITCDSQMLNIS